MARQTSYCSAFSLGRQGTSEDVRVLVDCSDSPHQLVTPDKPDGLNGSTQHYLKVHVLQSMKLNSFKGIDANGTLLCLGSD